jgi:ABC-type transport system involved in multi-copper enzyme maturation permease subunit
LRIRTRAFLVLALIGLGLVIGAQITPGGTTFVIRPAGSLVPDINFLLPTTISISVASLNGSALLIVAQITGNLTSSPPIVNASVIQKDIVTFSIPTRGYYEVAFLASDGTPVAVTYTLTEKGQPPDQTFAGSVLLIAGAIALALSVIVSRRRRKHYHLRNSSAPTVTPLLCIRPGLTPN